jgi:threonine synthase
MFAYKQLKALKKPLVFSVPSGNFGNICAGMVAQKMGFPIAHFIASNNANNVVTRYLDTNSYDPYPSVQTISNAMDVGNPSNFIRIQALYDNDINILKSNLSSYSFSDNETKTALKTIYSNSGYIADPHGAVGYLGAKTYLTNHPNVQTVFLETAHPTKFLDVVKDTISVDIALPPQIQLVIDQQKKAILIENYDEFKAFMLKF